MPKLANDVGLHKNVQGEDQKQNWKGSSQAWCLSKKRALPGAVGQFKDLVRWGVPQKDEVPPRLGAQVVTRAPLPLQNMQRTPPNLLSQAQGPWSLEPGGQPAIKFPHVR